MISFPKDAKLRNLADTSQPGPDHYMISNSIGDVPKYLISKAK